MTQDERIAQLEREVAFWRKHGEIAAIAMGLGVSCQEARLLRWLFKTTSSYVRPAAMIQGGIAENTGTLVEMGENINVTIKRRKLTGRVLIEPSAGFKINPPLAGLVQGCLEPLELARAVPS